MSEPLFTLTLDVTAESESAVTNFAVAHLRERGFHVVAPGVKWETPAAFSKRVGIFGSKLRAIVTRYRLRGGPPIQLDERGESKRIAALQSNPQFDEFCRSIRRGPRQ